MPELTYGFADEALGSHIQVAANYTLISRINSMRPEFSSDLVAATNAQTVIVERVEEGQSFDFDFKRAWRKKDDSNKHRALRAAERVLITLANHAGKEDEDEPLYASIGTRQVSDGRFNMYAIVQWPEVDQDSVAALATERMRVLAEDLRYARELKPANRQGMVYAQIDRKTGVTLETNPMTSCGLVTDGSAYSAMAPTFELTATNLYSPEQQIICLAGAIAIANADELAKK